MSKKKPIDDEQAVAVCSPIVWGKSRTIGRKSICSIPDCNTEVWLSDSTIRAMNGKEYIVICYDCFLELMKDKNAQVNIAPPTNEQLLEIKFPEIKQN